MKPWLSDSLEGFFFFFEGGEIITYSTCTIMTSAFPQLNRTLHLESPKKTKSYKAPALGNGNTLPYMAIFLNPWSMSHWGREEWSTLIFHTGKIKAHQENEILGAFGRGKMGNFLLCGSIYFPFPVTSFYSLEHNFFFPIMQWPCRFISELSLLEWIFLIRHTN